jgi:enamine deaminase RidA (YjgF/YER057c/UK114 family)
MAGTIDARLKELGLTLPDAPAPVANYVPWVKSGNLVFVSGQVSREGGKVIAGKLGKELDVAAAQKAAKTCALAVLAQLKAACGGDLDRVRRCVKVGGFVNSTSDAVDQPQVINGFSDTMVDVLGEVGRHARFAVGVNTLPMGAAVEVDAVFEVAP